MFEIKGANLIALDFVLSRPGLRPGISVERGF